MAYDYLILGPGFQPKKPLLVVQRKHPNHGFNGWTINLSKTFNLSDWGASIQRVINSSTCAGPIGIGLEFNYKSIENTNRFGFKPLIGLSFPLICVSYAYNFDFYNVASERLNQHELIVGFRFPLLKRMKK